MNKTSMIALIRAERSRFESALSQLSEAQMTEIPMEGEWTAKDLIAHVSAWERWLLEWLKNATRGETQTLPEPDEALDEVERFNARTFAENRHRPLHDILLDFHMIYAQLQTVLETLPDDPDDERYLAWGDGEPFWQLIAANTVDHYREHVESVQNWLDNIGIGSFV